MRKLTAAILIMTILVMSVSVSAYTPSDWAKAQTEAAERLGIGYKSGAVQYNKTLSRGELAYVATNLHKLMNETDMALTDADRNRIAAAFVDSYNDGGFFSDEIIFAINNGLMVGTSEDTFSAGYPVTREQTATVLYRIAEKSGAVNMSDRADLTKYSDYNMISAYAYEPFSAMVGHNVLSGKSADKLEPAANCTYEEVLAIAVRFHDLMGKSHEQEIAATPIVDTSTNVQSPSANYSYGWEMGSYEEVYGRKEIPIIQYMSNEEALLDMKSITINVWSLTSGGEKVPSTKTILVHKDVVDDVIGIFDEIYGGSERFPIQSVGGYSWRGAGSRSSHNNGLAIDINPEQNYFIDIEGNILSGSHWRPHEDPLSITPEGDVVRSFTNKGWYWGGYGWSTTGYDYMHFSHTGE